MKKLLIFTISLSSIFLTSCDKLSKNHVENLSSKYPAIETPKKAAIKKIKGDMVFKYLPVAEGKIKFKGGTIIENCKIGKESYTVLSTTSELLGTSVWVKGLKNPNDEFALLQVKDKFKFGNLCLIKSVCINAILTDHDLVVPNPFCLKTTMPSPNCDILFKQVQCKNDKDCR